MLAGREHRRNSDSWRDIVRERPGDSRIWVGVLGRDRCGREELPQSDQAERVLHTEGHHDGYGLRWPRNRDGGHRHRKWKSPALEITLFFLVLGALVSCSNGRAPDFEFADANREFIHGKLEKSQQDAHRGYQRFRERPEWAWKFRVLEARAALWRGMHPDVLRILDTPAPSDQPNILISEISLLGIANAYIHNFPEAERLLLQATELCAQQFGASCGELLQARGLLASQQGNSSSAADLYQQALVSARSHGDLFLESSALLNLAAESLALGHFDEAIDYSQASLRIAEILHARVLELANQANIGWAKYRLGDSDGALPLFLDAEKLAAELGDDSDQENELTNLGYIYMDEGKLDQANHSFSEALDLAKKNNLKEHVYNALRVLARLSLRRADLVGASEFASQALELARE